MRQDLLREHVHWESWGDPSKPAKGRLVRWLVDFKGAFEEYTDWADHNGLPEQSTVMVKFWRYVE